MTALKGAAKAYLHQAIMTASREKLVVLMYEAALRELDRARDLINERAAIARTGEALGKAFSIVSELKASLDMEAGGEISQNLDQLYGFVQANITRANRDRSVEAVEEARQIMAELKEGWDAILRSA